MNKQVLSRLTPKPSEFQNSLEDSKLQFPSFSWLIHFLELHKTVLKNGSQILATFQQSSVKFRESCQPIGRKGLNLKSLVHALRVLQIQKHLVLSDQELMYELNIISKGELKI